MLLPFGKFTEIKQKHGTRLVSMFTPSKPVHGHASVDHATRLFTTHVDAYTRNGVKGRHHRHGIIVAR